MFESWISRKKFGGIDKKSEPFKGGTRKIADAPPRPCCHPSHSPPGYQVFEPGTHQHVCPGCGSSVVFVIPAVYL